MSTFPNSQMGKWSRLATTLNKESEAIGVQVLQLSQGGNAAAGTVANIQSLLASKAGDKQTFVYVDPKVEAMTLNMIKQSSDLTGEQKKLLEQAQEKRNVALELTSKIYGGLAAEIFGGNAGANGGGDFMVRAAAMIPAYKETQDTMIATCVINEKWEQAMRAKNVTVPDKSKAISDLNKLKDIKDE